MPHQYRLLTSIHHFFLHFNLLLILVFILILIHTKLLFLLLAKYDLQCHLFRNLLQLLFRMYQIFILQNCIFFIISRNHLKQKAGFHNISKILARLVLDLCFEDLIVNSVCNFLRCILRCLIGIGNLKILVNLKYNKVSLV